MCGTLSGNRWNDYTSSYWDEWSEANQVGDSVDAILLSDRPDAYGELPQWFYGAATKTSKWTLETFSKIVNDDEFTGKGIWIYLAAKKYDFSSGSPEETFWFYPREGSLCLQFAEEMRLAEAKRMAEEMAAAAEAKRKAEEARRAAEDRRKREAELAEAKRKAEEARRAAEDRRKREAELAEAKRKAEEMAAVAEAKRKAEEARRTAEDRRKRIFENASVKRLFSEWQRLCGAYCQYIPELTYRVQDAGRCCVQGIALPRNYLKDVALKFLSGSVSPSFQGRGETEWVKDRGAVLGILLLHYIGSSDFNPSGEEVEDLRQIYQLAQRQSIQDRLVAHIHKYLEIE